jgi:hypothetical protein
MPGREDHNPWTKWYWQDYLSDENLSDCSLAAQGLWMRMLGYMARSEKRGYLIFNGNQKESKSLVEQKQIESKILAKRTHTDEKIIEQLIGELEENGVFSRDENGIIFSRRLVREAELSRIRSEAGRKGGRPSLKRDENHIESKLKAKENQNESKDESKLKAASASASAYASVSEYASDERIEERKSEGKKEGKQEEEKLIGDIIAKWNTFAQEHGLAKVDFIKPGTTRYQKLKARLKEKEFDFDAILKEIERSDFLKGASSNWRVTFDWIVCPNNYPKVLEGQYRNKGAGYMTNEELVAEYERSKKVKEQKNG